MTATYSDVMISWLKNMPEERIACENMSDPKQGVLATFCRDVLNYRGHAATNKFIYMQTKMGISYLQDVTQELTDILAIVDEREDLPLRIPAGLLRKAMREAYQQIQKRKDYVESTAIICEQEPAVRS